MATLSGLLNSDTTNKMTLGETTPGQATPRRAPEIVVTEQAKLISLHGYTTGTNQSSTMRKHGASAGYQVPVGKKLLILGVTYGRTAGGGIANLDQIGIQGMDTDLGLSSSSSAVNPDLKVDPGNLGQINTSDEKYGFIPYFYVVRPQKFIHFFTNTGQYSANISALEIAESDTSFTGAYMTIAGQTLANLGRLKTLVWGSNSSGPVATPREAGFNVGYTPPAGRKFIALASYLTTRSASAGDVYTLETASNDIGLYSSTAPSTVDTPGFAFIYGGGVNAAEMLYRRHHIVLEAGRYLYASGGNARMDGTIYGYEMDENATSF